MDFPHPYQLDEYISNLRQLIISFNFESTFCKRTVQNLIRGIYGLIMCIQCLSIIEITCIKRIDLIDFPDILSLCRNEYNVFNNTGA